MEVRKVHLIDVTPQELSELVANQLPPLLKELLKESVAPTEKEAFLSRKEVANLFKVNLSTIHHWTKQNKLKSYGIGNRVYYKMSELEQCLIPLN